MNFIDYQVISFILLNKIMNRMSTQPPLFRLTKQDIKSYLPISRVQLKTTNPEITPIKQNKSDLYKYQNQDDIKSPFQKDQFLQNYTHNRQFNHNHHSNFKDAYGRNQTHNNINKTKHTNTPQLIKISQITTNQSNMSKSWTNHTPNVQQDYNLQEIIYEISDKRQYQKAKRQIYKLQNRSLKYKLQNIISKLQAKQSLSKSMEFISARQSLVKILRNHFRYEKSVELYSTQRIIKQLQKSILLIIAEQTKVNRKQSQQKIKEMKEESKLLNSKLQKQTNELNKVLQRQKLKLKEKYEEIYRKIYQETNKLKKEFQIKELELQKQRKQTQTIKIKYQSIFTEISQQFQQIKKQYNKLIESSSKQLKKNKHLQQQNKHINKKLAQQQDKIKQYQLQFLALHQKNRLLEDQKKKLQTVNSKYKGYAEKFIYQTKKYRDQKIEKGKEKEKEKEKNNNQQKNNIQIKGQQQQLTKLLDNIKNKQEILCKNVIKIQQCEANILQKMQKIVELDQKIEDQVEIYKSYNNKINYQISQLQKLQKMFEQTQQLVEKKQKNYGQLSQRHNLLIENCKQKQQQSKGLSISFVLSQLSYERVQQQNSLIEAKYAKTLTALRELQENAEKQRNQNKRERETKQTLERQINVINEEIIAKKEKLMRLKIDEQIQEQKLLSQAAQLKATQQQKLNKQSEIKQLQKSYILTAGQKSIMQQQIKQLEKSNNILHTKNEELNLQILNRHRQIQKISQRKNIIEQQNSLFIRKQQQKHDKESQISILSQIKMKKQQEIASISMILQEKQKEVEKRSFALDQLNNQILSNKIILENQVENIKNNQNTQRVILVNMQQLQQKYNQELLKYEEVKKTRNQLQRFILQQQTNLKLKALEKIKIQEQICLNQIKFNQIINKIQYVGEMQQENKKIILAIEVQQLRYKRVQQQSSLIEAKYASTLAALRELQENAEKQRNQNKRERETKQTLERQISVINEEIIAKKEKLMRLKIDEQIQEQKLLSQAAQFKATQQQKQNKQRQLQQISLQASTYTFRQKELQTLLQQSLHNQKFLLCQIDKDTDKYNNIVILCKKQEEILQLNMNNNKQILVQIQNNRLKLAKTSQQLSHYQNLSSQLLQQLNVLKTSIDNLRNCQHELQNSIKVKQQEIKQIEQMLSNKYQLIKSIQDKFRVLQLNISCFQKQNESNIKSQVETNWSYSQQQKVKSQVEQIKLTKQKLSAEIELMKKQKQHLIADLRQLEASLSQISTYLQSKRGQMKYIQKSLSDKYEQLVTLQSEILIKKRQL